jgi:hypothetical protein
MTDHELFYGVDRRKIELAMAKARRERNAAMREFFKGLFRIGHAKPALPEDLAGTPAAAVRLP